MGAWYTLGIRFRHPRIEEGNAPAVVAPAGIMLFIPVCALWLIFTLIYSAAPGLSTVQQLTLAICGAVAPMAIAYGLITNRSWTRIGILATVGANILFFLRAPDSAFAGQFVGLLDSIIALSIVLAVIAGLGSYLYLGAKPRKYYLLIAGAALPENLRQVDLAPPHWLASGMRMLASLSEWILIFLALAIFFGLIFLLPQVVEMQPGY